MRNIGSTGTTEKGPQVDADVFAVAFMARQAMLEVARLKAPDDPGRELKRMRDEILQAIKRQKFTTARTPEEVRIRSAVFTAIDALMPLGTDVETLQ